MADRMLVAFGKYLRLVRDRRKMSLSDVVTLTKSYPEPIGKGYLSRVERGLARVGFSKMVALSRAYEIPLDAFGEKLALDLEVAQLKNGPNTAGKTYGELAEEGKDFSQRGLRLHFYAAIRDALSRAATDPILDPSRSRLEQEIRAVLSHGVAARSNGKYWLALVELGFVLANRGELDEEIVPIVFQQLGIAKLHLGAIEEARAFSEQAVEIAKCTRARKHVGDALDTRAYLSLLTGQHTAAVAGYQEAFAAFKAAGRRIDCARTMNNIAQAYFDDQRVKAARRALTAAERIATEIGADAIRARSRILLGEIEIADGSTKKASALWHDAIEIARRTHDTVAHFKAEFQLFKLSIAQGNKTAVQALGRRLNRMTPWISRSEPEVDAFIQLYAVHRKPKQRGVASPQLDRIATGNPESAKPL
jgi:tetratricopeptide (TPR) repeat protein